MSDEHSKVRHAAWLTAVVLLTGCATAPQPVRQDRTDHTVVFALYPDAAGKLQRLAVSRVLDKRSGRTIIELPSALFVDRARDTLAERTWTVTFDRGEIQPVYVQCVSPAVSPDTPSCSESD